jgi:hypothetical protein
VLKASAHGLGPAGQLLLLPVSGQVVHVTPKPPKWQVDRAVLGACQRCSPPPIRIESQQAWSGCGRTTSATAEFGRLTKHAPAANFGARFCCRVVDASVDTRRSDLRSSRFRARSRGLSNQAYGVGTAGAPKRVDQGIFRDLGGTNPKTTGRLGGPGDLSKAQPAHPDL